jgi:sugar phosphate isomerase/epimerase
MQLSLSGRIAEQEDRKDQTSVAFEELARVAAAIGYRALCIRPAQASTETPDAQLYAMRETLQQAGLQASMVCPQPSIAANRADAGQALHDFGRALEVAAILGAPLIRVGMKSEADLVPAQRAADQAAERGIRLAHQTHTDSPFESIDDCLAMLARINRPNFGLIVEPANLLLAGQPYGAAALAKVAPSIFNVYVQNVRVVAGAPHALQTRRGTVHYERLMVGDPGGVDFADFFEGLKATGYDGFVTSHQPAMPGMDVRELAATVYEKLAVYMGL